MSGARESGSQGHDRESEDQRRLRIGPTDNGVLERIAVSALFIGLLVFFVYVTQASIDEAAAPERGTVRLWVTGAWLASALSTLAYQLHLATNRHLILRTASERAENHARIEQSLRHPGVFALAGIAVAAGALSPTTTGVWAGLLGGFLLIATPVFVWIAITNPAGREDDRE